MYLSRNTQQIRCPTQSEGDAGFCNYKASKYVFVLALMVSDFAIKIEAKGNFENSPESQTFCMTCGGFFTLFACMCFLTFTLTNNSQTKLYVPKRERKE